MPLPIAGEQQDIFHFVDPQVDRLLHIQRAQFLIVSLLCNNFNNIIDCNT